MKKFCPNCKQATEHRDNSCSHLLHLIVTLITGGLWLLPWIYFALTSREPTCNVCGCEN